MIQAAISYWLDSKNNIFRNYVDALFGILPLVVLPAFSLFSIRPGITVDVWNYTFPISCLSIAGIYDAYGRMSLRESKNLKLGIRIALDGIALLLSSILLNCGDRWWRILPSLMLILSGVLLAYEIWLRVTTAIQMSEWYPG